MTKFIIFMALVVSGSILGYLYYQTEKSPVGTEVVAPQPGYTTIHIVDGFKDGIHRISGAVKLPHSCYSLQSDAVVDPIDPSLVSIILTSKDNILDQPVCAQIRTQYPFELVIEAEQNIKIKLILDGSELPITVARTDWQNPSGSIINSGNPL